MDGGPGNPLGARAMYLYRGGNDSLFRIHGTNQPWTIGHNMSSGCIRMMNQDVEHLYERVPSGTKVIVIGPDGSGPKNVYADLGPARKNLLQGDLRVLRRGREGRNSRWARVSTLFERQIPRE